MRILSAKIVSCPEVFLCGGNVFSVLRDSKYFIAKKFDNTQKKEYKKLESSIFLLIGSSVITKGNVFDGFLSGKMYDRLAGIFGFGPSLYKKAAELIVIEQVQVILDLGCGTGSFSAAIVDTANIVGTTGEIHGVDLSKKQLDIAKEKVEAKGVQFVPHLCSMDELPFSSSTFDLVISSLAFHATNPSVRRMTIKETARVLKRNGSFVLVDMTRPKTIFTRLLYLPFSPIVYGESARDNWNNVFPELCENEHLALKTDKFVNSFVRFQQYVKTK